VYFLFASENLPYNGPECRRTRLFTMVYFVADETLKVVETVDEHSGLDGGLFAKRNLAPKPDKSGYYGVGDFQIGSTVDIFGTKFTIYDASSESRLFLKSRFNISLNEPLAVPENEYRASILDQEAARFHLKNRVGQRIFIAPDKGFVDNNEGAGYLRSSFIKKQLEDNRGACLTFYGVWLDLDVKNLDDLQKKINTSKHHVTCRYFLEDDTIEVLNEPAALEKYKNARLYSFKRGRLPRTNLFIPEFGQSNSEWISIDLSIKVREISSMISKCYCSSIFEEENHVNTISDLSLLTFCGFPVFGGISDGLRYVTPADLVCSGIVSILGSPLLLFECDDFTKIYGRLKLNAIDYSLTLLRQQSSTSIQSNADSVPRTNKSFDCSLFHAKLHPLNLSDHYELDRRFVLKYYSADDTLLINEIDERQYFIAKIVNRDHHVDSMTGKGILKEDLTVGRVFQLQNFPQIFEIIQLETPKVSLSPIDEASGRIAWLWRHVISSIDKKCRQIDRDNAAIIKRSEFESILKQLRVLQSNQESSDFELLMNEFTVHPTIEEDHRSEKLSEYNEVFQTRKVGFSNSPTSDAKKEAYVAYSFLLLALKNSLTEPKKRQVVETPSRAIDEPELASTSTTVPCVEESIPSTSSSSSLHGIFPVIPKSESTKYSKSTRYN
jgi:DUF1126 PH-like domain